MKRILFVDDEGKALEALSEASSSGLRFSTSNMRCIGRLAGAVPRSYFASASGYVLLRNTVNFDSSMGCVMSAGLGGAVMK